MRELYGKVFASPYALSGKNWRLAMTEGPFKYKAPISLLFLITVGVYIPHFFNFIQHRPGIVLNDALLNLFTPKDVSWYIFPIMYVSLVITFINLIPFPELFIRAVQAYTLLLLVRIVCLYYVPLEPSSRIIPLQDPFIGGLFYSGTPVTKDLFFSGHVSTLFLLWLINPTPALKNILLLCTITVACLILLQHVHYTVDILAAPFFAWGCYRLTLKNISYRYTKSNP
jgi:hypothetical protein